MHGLIVNQLRRYVVDQHGRTAWAQVLEASGVALPDGPPPIDRMYPDEDVTAIVAAASRLTGTPVADLLEDFGAFLASALLRVYAPLVRSDWRTLDVIEHTEVQIHTAVRLRDRQAGPPYLTAHRVSPDEVHVVYTSPRRLCAVAEGIIRGLAAHFGDRVAVEQQTCMLRGDPECLIVTRRSAS